MIAPASRDEPDLLGPAVGPARAHLGLLHGTGPLGIGLEVGDDVHDVRRGSLDGDARLGALRHAAEATGARWRRLRAATRCPPSAAGSGRSPLAAPPSMSATRLPVESTAPASGPSGFLASLAASSASSWSASASTCAVGVATAVAPPRRTPRCFRACFPRRGRRLLGRGPLLHRGLRRVASDRGRLPVRPAPAGPGAGRRSRACTSRCRRGHGRSSAGSGGRVRWRCSRHPFGPLRAVLERERVPLPVPHPALALPAGPPRAQRRPAGRPAGTSAGPSPSPTGSSQISMLPASAPRTAHCTPLTPRSRVTRRSRSGHQRAHDAGSATSAASAAAGVRRRSRRRCRRPAWAPACRSRAGG